MWMLQSGLDCDSCQCLLKLGIRKHKKVRGSKWRKTRVVQMGEQNLQSKAVPGRGVYSPLLWLLLYFIQWTPNEKCVRCPRQVGFWESMGFERELVIKPQPSLLVSNFSNPQNLSSSGVKCHGFHMSCESQLLTLPFFSLTLLLSLKAQCSGGWQYRLLYKNWVLLLMKYLQGKNEEVISTQRLKKSYKAPSKTTLQNHA